MKQEIAEAGKKKRRSNWKNSPVIGDNGLLVQPGDNARYTKLAWEAVNFPPVDRNDIPALEKRMSEYIQWCVANDIKPGNMTCYSALGINKDIAYAWEVGRMGTPAHFDFIQKVKRFCASNREVLMQDNKLNVITGIFWQKNYDGLSDKQEVVITSNTQSDEYDAEAIRRRYMIETKNEQD